MADPKRFEPQDAADAADRDSRTEALLLEGLDCYFGGRYEEAIHIWTRVLFLDRSHARARAYIDRARTTLSERQRLSEEMLQASQDLLEQGRTEAARNLFTEAVATTGDDERASALRVKLERRERLDRLETTPMRRAGDHASRRSLPSAVPWRWNWAQVVLIAAISSVMAIAFVALGNSPAVRDWLGMRSTTEQLATSAAASRWPAPLSSDDVALLRAKNLYSRGRLAEALQALDRVDLDSPARSAADELRIDIQQLLLTSGPERFASKAEPR